MSKVQKPVILDDTGKQIVDKLHTQNLLLNVIAGSAIESASSLEEIHRIVQSGHADKVFNIGDQIIIPWTDRAANKTYEVPLDVVHFGNVTLYDGESVPAMFLQWHYATPFGVQFSARQAFYVVPEAGMPAGTYHFNVTTAYGKTATGTYQFTVSTALTKDAQLVFDTNYYEAATGLVGATLSVYADGMATTPLYTYTVTSGDAGTDLGEFIAAGTEKLTSIQSACWGYNRWAKSAMRQWLNKEGNTTPEHWWVPKLPTDRRPIELATKYGFTSGFKADFLSIIKPIKVTTAKNTVNDDGALEDNYDLFFLPSLVNEHIKPQIEGEGEVFEYWKRASQSATPLEQGGTFPQMRTYAVENHASPQTVRLRSAYRGDTSNTWHVYSSGTVYSLTASWSHRCAPVCAVC